MSAHLYVEATCACAIEEIVLAIFHLHAQIISRKSGRSVVAAAAYRAAERLKDKRLGRTHNFSRKEGVEHKEIIAPSGSPAWVFDREKLWNAVDAIERRKDAQLARELNIALPAELSRAAQIELVRGYVNDNFVALGMVADVAIHRDNPDNPHAHVMLTMRPIEGERFGKKERRWNRPELLLCWRSEWAHQANLSLERAGHDVRIDHRSLDAQGIQLEPSRKLRTPQGEHPELIELRLDAQREIAFRNGEAIRKDPEIALDALTKQRATFTRADLARWLGPRTLDADQFIAAFDRVMTAGALVGLGKDRMGDERLTTRRMQELEQSLMSHGMELAKGRGHIVQHRFVEQAERTRTLSREQRAAFVHLTSRSGDLAIVQGYAGAGKSYMLGACRSAWEAQGFRVMGAALAGKAAEGLEVSSGIASRSLASWEHGWASGRDQLRRGDVLVIDEAGMVGTHQMARVLEYARTVGSKVVLVGDTNQLQAIEAGAPLRALAGQIGQVVLSDIRRQKEQWQAQASLDLARGSVKKALAAYKERSRVHPHKTQASAQQAIVAAWDAHRKQRPRDAQLMMAYRRAEVRALNVAAREIRRAAGELGKEHTFDTAVGTRSFSKGDRVYFLKNDRTLGVKNGSLGTIEGIKGSAIVVRLDSERRVALDVSTYDHIDHGYAATVHKAQGVTVDRAHVLASNLFDRHAAYVALTRHVDRVDLHWSKEEFKREQDLHKALCRDRPKDLVLDYAAAHQTNLELSEAILEREHTRSIERPQLNKRSERVRPRQSLDIHEAPTRVEHHVHQPRLRPLIPIRRAEAEIERAAERAPAERAEEHHAGIQRAMGRGAQKRRGETEPTHRIVRKPAEPEHRPAPELPFVDEKRPQDRREEEKQRRRSQRKSEERYDLLQKIRDARKPTHQRAKLGSEERRKLQQKIRETRKPKRERGRLDSEARRELREKIRQARPRKEKRSTRELQLLLGWRAIERHAKERSITPEQAFQDLKEVQRAEIALDHAEHRRNAARREREQFEGAHPMLAKLARNGFGASAALYTEERQAERALAMAEKELDRVHEDPELHRRAEENARAFNASIEKAQKDLIDLRSEHERIVARHTERTRQREDREYDLDHDRGR